MEGASISLGARAFASGSERPASAWPAGALPTELEAELAQVETTPQTELLDLRAAVEDALDLVSRLAASRSVTIESRLGDALPAVVATRTILRQILLNLLTYFISSLPPGPLGISASETPAGVELSFVPGPTRARSVDRLTSATPESTRSLEVASRLAESQEGSIRIDPHSAGRGAVHLHLLTGQATFALVVDDNPSLVRLFRRYVRGEGFRLAQARNGIRAHQLALALRPDVIIMDLMMPVQDGWDLFRVLQQDPKTAMIPVVACSILPERALALSLGARDFLPKPVTPESLLAALQPFRRRQRPAPASATDGAERPGSP